MPKSKARKNVDENFKVAAVQRLQTGGVPANDLAKVRLRSAEADMKAGYARC